MANLLLLEIVSTNIKSIFKQLYWHQVLHQQCVTQCKSFARSSEPAISCINSWQLLTWLVWTNWLYALLMGAEVLHVTVLILHCHCKCLWLQHDVYW